jgi:hypothetical protein
MSSNEKVLMRPSRPPRARPRAAAAAQTRSGDKEKCYGIAKAGQNDCGTAQPHLRRQGEEGQRPENGNTSPRAPARKLGGKTKAPGGK